MLTRSLRSLYYLLSCKLFVKIIVPRLYFNLYLFYKIITEAFERPKLSDTRVDH